MQHQPISGQHGAAPTRGKVWVPSTHLAEGTREFAAHLRAAITGPEATMPSMHYWPTGHTDGSRAQYLVILDAPCYTGPTITVSLTVENAYELYPDVTAYVIDAVIPAPPADRQSTDYDDWSYEHIYEAFTGVGNDSGDSWYDVTVTACSDPRLVGETFDWGY